MRIPSLIRQLAKKLTLLAAATVGVLSIAVAAVPGFPFTEDFTSDALRDAGETTADWDTALPGTLRLGNASSLTGLGLSREEMGRANDTAHETRGIVLGDFDNDGDLDAAVGNRNEVNLVYTNNNGNFTSSPVDLGTDAATTLSIAVGDLDGDGDLDLVAGNRNDPNVYYLNNGSGQFSDAIEVTSEQRTTWPLLLADIDRDGDLDLIEGNDGSRNQIYLNRWREDGSLSFDDGENLSTDSFNTRALAMGDVNGDGFDDLVTGEGGSPNNLYLGNGSGGFSTAIVIQPLEAWATFSLALADIDGDGHLDLVEGSQNTGGANGETRVYLNADGLGTFGVPTKITGSLSEHTTVALIAMDFDRDGDIDILEGNNGVWDDDGDGGAATPDVPQPNRMYFNDGTGSFPSLIEIVPSENERTYGAVAGDLDNDGILDFVTGNQAGRNAAYTVAGTETGTPVRQLHSVAASLRVDDNSQPNFSAVRLTANVTNPTAADLQFFVSNDDGATYVPIRNGRPAGFANPANNALRWKVLMSTRSPDPAQTPTIDQIEITANNAPVFSNLGNLNATEGVAISPAFNIAAYFSDPDGDNLDFQVSGLPNGTGLTLNASNGQLNGTPTNADSLASPITLSLSAFDGAESDGGNITLTIGAVNNGPTAVNDGPFVVDEGGSVPAGSPNLLDNDSDPENDPLTAVLVTGPANAASFALNPNGTFSYTHDGSETTSDSFTYTANDADGPSNVATVSITVNPVNDQPVITLNGPSQVTLQVGNVYSEQGATVDDAEDGDISGNLVIDSGAVNTGAAGTYSVSYNAMDNDGLAAATVTRTVVVNAAPPPPPPPPSGGGGGLTGLWEMTLLLLGGLISLNRRRIDLRA